MIRTIAVMTSGGDAPGMNLYVRAVVRTALGSGLQVKRVRRGFEGLAAGGFDALGPRDGIMVGLEGRDNVVATPLPVVCCNKRSAALGYSRMARMLAK